MNGENPRRAARDERFPPYAEAGFDEVPPPEIDRAILAEADRVAARRTRRFKPAYLAWAAAVLLSIAVVLETGLGPGVAPEHARTISEPVTDLGGTAPRDAERASSAAESAELRVAPVRPEARDAADDLGAPRLERFAAPPPGATAPAADGARAAASTPDARCGEEARGDVAAWLTCIAELREAGEDAAADAELEALRLAYPSALENGNRAPR